MRYCKTAAFALVTVACLAGCAARPPLWAYLDRDLMKLSKAESDELARHLKEVTGAALFEAHEGVSFQPFCVRRFETGDVSWLFLEAHLAYSAHDVSIVRAHLFDSDWKRCAVQIFPVGHRFLMEEAIVVDDDKLDENLLVVKAVSIGPFLEVGGKKSPALEQGEFQREFYALLEGSFVLVRLEDDKGRIVPNDYTLGRSYKGPDFPAKEVEEWLQALESSNAVEQLAALVWLTGKHLSSAEPRHAYLDQETIGDSKVYEAVRDDPRNKDALDELLD
jgi:hypothetical protein